jgi:type IV pilus assembly protein PilA
MLKKFITRVARGQKGFTLIEMIVVVGIIAVLAAVIVPNIGRFIGSGEQGAMDAEAEAVQTAMNAMMADVAITAVDPLAAPSNSTSDWSALPTGTDAATLDAYLQNASTTYFYCYNAQGQITAQHEAATACP